MKRARSEPVCAARKRRRASSHKSVPESVRSSQCLRPAPRVTPHSPCLESFVLAQSVDARQQLERAQSIPAWINQVLTSTSRSESSESFSFDDALVLNTMSESSRLRNMKTQRRSRSCSPTKKSPQYRNTVLKPMNILVDVLHNLPPDIEAILPVGLRDILDLPPPTPISTIHNNAATATNTDKETQVQANEVADRVSQIAEMYRDECRELAAKPGTEPEYLTHLYGDVVEKLARIPPWRHVLSATRSDKLWLASLKPPLDPVPIISLLWPPLTRNAIATTSQEHGLDSAQNSFNSDIIRARPDGKLFNFDPPPLFPEPSESSSASDVDGTITTPKPDVTLGISREAFSRTHANLLECWQASKVVLSDPHTTQGDMRFPFLIIEAKGLATNGNLIGAQNQAAGGGTCAIRLLASLAAQAPEVCAPRIVFSCTTEGAIHELWIHFQAIDGQNTTKHYMVCLGSWRTTLDRHARELVAALAAIFAWGVEVFFPQIKQVLDNVLLQAMAPE